MEVYQTEEQQIEAIKDSWHKYKRLILSLLAAMIIFIGGVNYFRNHSVTQMEQASDLYQVMINATLQKDLDAAKAHGEILMSGFSRTPYPQLSALMLAKIAVDENELDTAESHLQWVINQSKSKDLSMHIAKVRLSRLLKEKGDLDGALAAISGKVDVPAYKAIYEEAKGDLHAMQGDLDAAKRDYLSARDSMPEGFKSPFLEMKIMDLGVKEDK